MFSSSPLLLLCLLSSFVPKTQPSPTLISFSLVMAFSMLWGFQTLAVGRALAEDILDSFCLESLGVWWWTGHGHRTSCWGGVSLCLPSPCFPHLWTPFLKGQWEPVYHSKPCSGDCSEHAGALPLPQHLIGAPQSRGLFKSSF